jgi:twinkle protein
MNKDLVRQRFGSRAKEFIAHTFGFTFNRTGAICPFHDDHNPSMKWFNDGYYWKCFSCGKVTDIFDAYQQAYGLTFTEAMKRLEEELGLKSKVFVQEDEYVIPNVVATPISEEKAKCFLDRGISLETMQHFGVRLANYSMGNDILECLYFPFIDENGEEVFGKYRPIDKTKTDKKSWQVFKAKPILWNMQNIDTSEPLLICEGEPDAMTAHEVGFTNVVSIPMGTNNLKWIDTCYEWLENFETLIICSDNDNAGQIFLKKVIDRYGAARIGIVDIPQKYNDLNDYYQANGRDATLETLKNYTLVNDNSVLDVSKIELQNEIPGIATGWHSLSYVINDWRMHEFTVITGRPGEGKSTFMSNVLLNCIENLDNLMNQEVKVGIFSGELSANQFKRWVATQAVSSNMVTVYKNRYGKEKSMVMPEVLEKVNNWLNGKMYLYDNVVSGMDGNSILSTFEYMYRRFGVNVFLIDNLMTVDITGYGDSPIDRETGFLQAISDLIKKLPIHIFLVAHPRKDQELGMYSISGSSNIVNLAHNIMAVTRIKDINTPIDMQLLIWKVREEGDSVILDFKFNKFNKRFEQIMGSDTNPAFIINKYSWINN